MSCVTPFTEERSIFVHNTVRYLYVIYVKRVTSHFRKGEGYECKSLTRFFFHITSTCLYRVYLRVVASLESCNIISFISLSEALLFGGRSVRMFYLLSERYST